MWQRCPRSILRWKWRRAFKNLTTLMTKAYLFNFMDVSQSIFSRGLLRIDILHHVDDGWFFLLGEWFCNRHVVIDFTRACDVNLANSCVVFVDLFRFRSKKVGAEIVCLNRFLCMDLTKRESSNWRDCIDDHLFVCQLQSECRISNHDGQVHMSQVHKLSVLPSGFTCSILVTVTYVVALQYRERG